MELSFSIGGKKRKKVNSKLHWIVQQGSGTWGPTHILAHLTNNPGSAIFHAAVDVNFNPGFDEKGEEKIRLDLVREHISDLLDKHEVELIRYGANVEGFDVKEEEMYIEKGNQIFIDEDRTICIQLTYDSMETISSIRVASTKEEYINDVIDTFGPLASRYTSEPPKKQIKAIVHFLVATQGGIDVVRKVINKVNVEDSYYAPGVVSDLCEAIEKEGPGFIYLSGDPGAGKTTLIKYLSQEFPEKRFIFVLPETLMMLKEGGTVAQLTNVLGDDVLVFENAEGLFTDRNTNITGSAGLLLDITDGLLGEVLGVKVICTQNSTNNIDPAFLRSGRLLYRHNFEKLSVEQAKAAAKTANRAQAAIDTITEPMPLCEIFALPTTLHPEDVKVEVNLLSNDKTREKVTTTTERGDCVSERSF